MTAFLETSKVLNISVSFCNTEMVLHNDTFVIGGINILQYIINEFEVLVFVRVHDLTITIRSTVPGSVLSDYRTLFTLRFSRRSRQNFSSNDISHGD